ncbi:MAG TPA: putative Ig domain-containing protein, partial [Candidatus Dormibacteraeota bacterium]|nr:putative Ig domain-containing protein [Candidatus Dormibacteraeota bacterium]
FAVSVNGTAPRYQWFKDGALLSNATNGTFNIASAQPSQAGGYRVIVTNLLNAVTSRVATLTVSAPPNTPPHLVTPPDTTIDELTTLLVTNRATDLDLPPQTLQFALVSAPSGVALDALTGVLQWTPTEAQGPSVNPITVRVFDSGTPSLSATQTFTITVNEANVPPVLAFIPDYSVSRNHLLTFTNAASDADLPAQNLTFALEGTVPTGATIGVTSGVFAWTPNGTQGPSTNILIITVTDSGTPPMNASRSFSVIVTVPSAPAIRLTNNGDSTVTLEWDPAGGETYQVQFKDDLGTSNWRELGSPLTSDSGRISVTDPLQGGQRFYRVLVVE